MRRTPWRVGVLVALLAGIGLGLVYSWAIFPRGITDAEPAALRADFKDQYRSVIAAAYAANGNLPRAEARLSLLGDPDSIDALNAQAQRMLAGSQAFERADRVAALASALDENESASAESANVEDTTGVQVPTPTIEIINNMEDTFTATSSPPPLDVPIILTETPPTFDAEPTVVETQPTLIESTPRPTSTPTPEPGEPFALTGQESICDPNLPEGLLQVLVLNRSRRQLAGIEILMTWDGGEEQFFTGLKPELGNGYADFSMLPDTMYTVQLARGSDVALGIAAPTCQSAAGEPFLGGIKLTFQQP